MLGLINKVFIISKNRIYFPTVFFDDIFLVDFFGMAYVEGKDKETLEKAIFSKEINSINSLIDSIDVLYNKDFICCRDMNEFKTEFERWTNSESANKGYSVIDLNKNVDCSETKKAC